MNSPNPPPKKKVLLPLIISVVASFWLYIILIQYGPRKRSLFDTMLRPRKPFELLEYDGLTDTGKTIAVVAPIAVFGLVFYLLYHYINKKKLTDSEDID